MRVSWRKLSRKVVAGVLCCIIGVTASDMRWKVQPLDYCEVARNGEQYDTRYIRVRARLIFDSGQMYVFQDCDPTEALAAAVDFDGMSPSFNPTYVENLLVTGEKPPLKTAQAIIEGQFDANFSRGCWGPKYRIIARKIELISAPE